MATLSAASPSLGFFAAFLPVARAQLFPAPVRPITKRLPLLQRLRVSPLLPAALLPIPSLLQDIWDGLLRAVPKKKTSHSKKRHRQMAGKALKDVTALNKCSSCGRTKRAHVLCPYCVLTVRKWIGNGFKTQQELEVEEDKMHEVYNRERRLMGLDPLERTKKDGEKEAKKM